MNQKLENLLNLALAVPEDVRARSESLNVGFDPSDDRWDLILRYTGDGRKVQEETGVVIEPLISGYGLARVREEEIAALSSHPDVIYIEKPKRLYFSAAVSLRASCISAVRSGLIAGTGVEQGLFGNGVLIGLVDSGIDYMHPWFQTPSGESKIYSLWDQTVVGTPPEGFLNGNEYTKAEITQAIRTGTRLETIDTSGHGTAVSGIAVQTAPESELVVVKLGRERERGFPRTGELMAGVTYLLRTAERLGRPIAINLSFGNNYGSHDGTSILETFLDEVSQRERNCIVIGSGNEGAAGGHSQIRLPQGERGSVQEVIYSVGPGEVSLNVQIWKEYPDRFRLEVVTPGGEAIRVGEAQNPVQAEFAGGAATAYAYWGEPRPYSVKQEIYVDFIAKSGTIEEGLWTIRFLPENIVSGFVDLWLPVQSALSRQTRFFNPTPEQTLTIPSTAQKSITVGAYDARRSAYADFSGRGGDRSKPDLVAPGVAIETVAPGGGTQIVSGTSMAAPFVAGAAALLMEWGILKENDPFLYGEKVKAYLRRGAKRLPGYEEIPNERIGWGALCISESIPD